jgi:hypothetical protein
MSHHFVTDCSLDLTGEELRCDNINRFRHFRFTNAGQIEVTCQVQEHTIDPSDFPDDILQTETRRLYERGRDKPELKQRLQGEFQDRGMDLPENPNELSWYIVEVTDAESRYIQDQGYPEARQRSWPVDDDRRLNTEELEGSSGVILAMKVSDWGLRFVPDDVAYRAVPINESVHRELFN